MASGFVIYIFESLLALVILGLRTIAPFSRSINIPRPIVDLANPVRCQRRVVLAQRSDKGL